MRLHNPELLSLSRIEWQFFCTFTFKSERLTDRIRLSMFFALLRTQARNALMSRQRRSYSASQSMIFRF